MTILSAVGLVGLVFPPHPRSELRPGRVGYPDPTGDVRVWNAKVRPGKGGSHRQVGG